MSTVIGSVTINKNPNYPCNWWIHRLNQFSIMTADGSHKTYDNGPSLVKGILILRHVVKSEGDSLRTYLESTAYMGKVSFTITPPANTNLGKGDGTAITVYYDGGASLEEVFTLIAPGHYDINIPYVEAL
jgi:hypothetical protein